MLAARATTSLLIALAIGLMVAPPAQADELVELDSLESSVEAAGELVQMPTETDWGVVDPSSTLPAVPQDAPAVPAAPIEAPQEPRYHVEEPQYHAEYQAPAADPPPAPAPTPAPSAPPAAAPVDPPAEAAPEGAGGPAQPAPTRAATPAEPPSAPTIWVWVWNWTWHQEGDERYQNLESRYQIDDSVLERDLTEIIQSIETQIPIQIDIKTGRDITEEIVPKFIPGPVPTQQSVPVVSAAPRDAPPAVSKPRPRPRRFSSPPPVALERAIEAPLAVASVESEALARARRGGRDAARKAPRARRAPRGASELPRAPERFADSSAASSGAAGSVLKTIAVLVLSLLLAAFGHGRRIWLPVPRWRGLLGSRTDPPG